MVERRAYNAFVPDWRKVWVQIPLGASGGLEGRVIARLGKVLLLNATYEALGVISAPRALALVRRYAAEVVELNLNCVLHTPRYEFVVPSVVRLSHYVDTHRWRSRAPNRTRILVRDRYRCQYCGHRGTAFDLTLDHIFPKSRGGRSVAENLCAACRTCNNRKGDRTPEEARMPLLANPSALYYGLERAALQAEAQARPEWRKYLYLESENGQEWSHG